MAGWPLRRYRGGGDSDRLGRVSWRSLSSKWRARPEPRRGMVLDRLVADGYGLIGGVGEYEHTWSMAYVRGPEGIIVALAERIG